MAALRLEDEIAMFQFGQGVHTEVDMLNQFSQLNEKEKRTQFFKADFFVERLKPTEADMEQAIADSSLKNSPIPDEVLKHHRSLNGIEFMTHLPEDDLEQGYTLLLHLFKIVYQRHFQVKKGKAATWYYWDLSNPEVVQAILTRHQTLVEDVYNNPSFRSEFVSIAKLRHEHDLVSKTRSRESDPIPEPQTRFTFVGYDEMVTEWVKIFDDRHIWSIQALSHSVEKAIAKQYDLDTEEARRVVFEVIERHLRETYNNDLFD